MTMFRLIATVRTSNGFIERVVCESLDIDAVLSMDAYWSAQECTLTTRIEG